MNGEIIVTISPDGSSATTEVKGVKGKSCKDITKQLLEALGVVEQDKKTPEYFMEEQSVVHNQM